MSVKNVYKKSFTGIDKKRVKCYGGGYKLILKCTIFCALLLSFLLLSTTFISCAGGAGSPKGSEAEETALAIKLPDTSKALYDKEAIVSFTVTVSSGSFNSTKSANRGETMLFSNLPVGNYSVKAYGKTSTGAVAAKCDTTVTIVAGETTTTTLHLTRIDHWTVTFMNADGSELSTQDISDGYKATKPANPAPVSGKSFSGWTTDAEPSDTSPLFDFNTAISGDNITLRPVFGVITYTVKYVSPVGSFTDASFTAATASSYSLPPTSGVTGVTFDNWYSDSAFSSSVDVASVRDITTFTKKDDIHYEKTIYAKWTAKVQFKGENVSTHSIETIMTGFDGIWYGAKVSNPGDPTAPDGATFGGWYTGTYNESTGKVTFGSEYDFNSAVTEDITLYAKWNFVMHNVTYISAPRAVPTGTATEFREIEGIPTLPTISSPTAAGCSFVGWTQDENFTLDTTPITSIPENTTTDVTLYAIWKVGVTFMNDLGSTTSYVVYGGALTKPTDPTKSGATFCGWYTGTMDAEGNEVLKDAYDFDSAVTKSIDLYPKWDYVMHNVTYVSAPKDVPDGTATKFKEIQGIPTLPTITPDTNSGLTFVGWTQNENFTATTTPISSVAANTSTDVTLYAIWTANVTFDARGGTGAPASPTAVVYGGKVSAPATNPTPAVATEPFMGWYTSSDGGTTLSATAFDFDTEITEDLTLYAKYRSVIMKKGSDINAALKALRANYTPDKTFSASATPPDAGISTQILSDSGSNIEVKAWRSGTSIKYYAEGFTDSNVKIPLNADSSGIFDACTNLTLIDMSGFDTSNVTNMEGMFRMCRALTSITGLSGFDTSKVTSMKKMFASCYELTSLDITGFVTTNVTDMENMFNSCETLTSLDLSSFDTTKVTTMYYMFYQCKALSSLDVSVFNTTNVTNMGYMFYGCSELTTIYVSSSFITTSVSSSTGMFEDSTKLQGSAGTTYNSSKVDKTYARIDGGTSSPGYFTAK